MKRELFVAAWGLGGLVLGALGGLAVARLGLHFINDGGSGAVGFSWVSFAVFGAVFGLFAGLAAGLRRRA